MTPNSEMGFSVEMKCPFTGTPNTRVWLPRAGVIEAEKAGRESQSNVLAGEGSASHPGVSTQPDSTSTDPYVSGRADKENRAPLVTCTTPSSAYVFTHVLRLTGSPGPQNHNDLSIV